MLCLVAVVPTKYHVVHVRWYLLASHVVAIVTFDVINLFLVLIVGVATLNLDRVCRMHFVPFDVCQFVGLLLCKHVLWCCR